VSAAGDVSPFATAGSAGPPAAGRWLGRPMAVLDRVFDRIYGSRLNPLQQSGNLAILFFLVTLVSGLYLFLFYKIATPHASVEAIQQRLFLGSWMRSLHRYSADLAMVAILVHLLRKLAQGQTWGPRALAWVSGILLLGLVLACGWTGLVLVWDVQAQLLAVEGARLIDLLPLFSEPIPRMFSGEVPLSSSFFFMNLFMHVALPLGLAGLLGIHVARLARPALLPPPDLRRLALATLIVMAALAPVALPPEADLLRLPGRVPTDLLYAFWLPLARRISPLAHLALWLALFTLLMSLARLWRPGHAIRPSTVDEDRCTGCTHCYQDCPYEAIAMVQRERSSAQTSSYVARVDPSLCVGCGICSGSCAPMGVGPAGRSGRDQLVAARAFLEEVPAAARSLVVVACRHGHGDALRRLGRPGRAVFPSFCSGSVHTSVVELFLRRGVRGVVLLTCPPRSCQFREGPKWLAARLFEGREAALLDRVDRRRVQLLSPSPAELAGALSRIDAFETRLGSLTVQPEMHPDIDRICDLSASEELAREGIHG